MNAECPFKVGDVVEATSQYALGRKLRITEATPDYFKADMLAGDNMSQPIKVFRAGWYLYAKTCND